MGDMGVAEENHIDRLGKFGANLLHHPLRRAEAVGDADFESLQFDYRFFRQFLADGAVIHIPPDAEDFGFLL